MDLIVWTVKDRRLSAILSIHDLNLALRFADFFLFLKNGRVHTFARSVRRDPGGDPWGLWG